MGAEPDFGERRKEAGGDRERGTWIDVVYAAEVVSGELLVKVMGGLITGVRSVFVWQFDEVRFLF